MIPLPRQPRGAIGPLPGVQDPRLPRVRHLLGSCGGAAPAPLPRGPAALLSRRRQAGD